jgi:predicted dithiol-disulfide oxidoreductase (DUF899 family)
LEAEAELRRLNEQVAARRRALPAGGLIREDYVFESAVDGSKVRFSELFAPGKNSLVIYNMMFPRWSEDPRAGAPGGRTAELPLVEQPCPSCTSVVDGLEGAAFHLAERINLVVIAKTSPPCRRYSIVLVPCCTMSVEGLHRGNSCTRKSAGHWAASSPLPVTLGQSA